MLRQVENLFKVSWLTCDGTRRQIRISRYSPSSQPLCYWVRSLKQQATTREGLRKFPQEDCKTQGESELFAFMQNQNLRVKEECWALQELGTWTHLRQTSEKYLQFSYGMYESKSVGCSVSDSVTSWMLPCWALLFLEFSRQECWSGRSCPSLRDPANPRIKPGSPSLQMDSLSSEPPGKPHGTYIHLLFNIYL